MKNIKIVDGGFSTQLSTHVGDKIDGDPLWTARFLTTNPGAVFATHLDFLRAGADIILTNTYQASIEGFSKYLNLSREESLNVLHKAVDYARAAVNQYMSEVENKPNVPNSNPLVAGSCGPYGAFLHDGSEYTGKYCSLVTKETLMDWHRPRITALIESGVDLLAIETIPCKLEAEALLTLLKEFPDTKAWLSFSCRTDGKSLADGSNFQEVVTECYRQAPAGQLIAIGVNCITPQVVTSLLQGINSEKNNSIPLVVYPNSGEKYTVEEGWQKAGEECSLHQFIKDWLELGVEYIGGCCRTYAADIQQIRAEVQQWKAETK